MSDKPMDPKRRYFIRASLMTAAALPLAGVLGQGVARAAEDMPKLSPDDPQAKSLNYHEDATKVASGRQDGAFCHNCSFYQGSGDAQWGGCQIFPGKAVNRDGWCLSWQKAS
ncbi:MAG: high-potential iron-sulfur protein [Ectothiorhodospiraceae bacterium]|jgi:hypothetical protein